jgi:predicted RNA-binding Zn-ribbon protein involved in translation (DUF1610 family)
MIFSGRMTQVRCPECGTEFSRVLSTSLLFYLLLLGVGVVLSYGPLAAVLGHGPWVSVLCLVLNFAFLFLLQLVTHVIITRTSPLPDRCPDCGVEMERSGGLFDFSFMPSLQDLLMLVGFVAAVLVLWRTMP